MGRATILALSIVLGATEALAADLFEERLAEARANEATPEWEVYSPSFFESFGPVLQRSMQKCFPPSAKIIDGTFTILFAIQADGSLAHLMVRPDTEQTACALEGIRDARVPSPPRPSWWEFLEMKITP